MDGHPGLRFNVQKLGYVALSDGEFIRLRLQRKWRERLLPRHRRVAERLESGKTPPTAVQVGTGSGELCAACDEPILPSHGKLSYPRALGQAMHVHEQWSLGRRGRYERPARLAGEGLAFTLGSERSASPSWVLRWALDDSLAPRHFSLIQSVHPCRRR